VREYDVPPVKKKAAPRAKVAAPRIPPDLAKALRAYPQALANFRRFPPSQRRGMIEWIEAAKKPATRARRVAETAKFADWNVENKSWRWGH
jgi:uncharacterized protein YdeI (YjbR/CyaY-like superfamily)